MKLNPFNILMISLLIVGTLLTLSSSSILMAWMGLEINLMSMIPLILNDKTYLNNNAPLVYFLIQALGSSIILFIMISIMLKMNNTLKTSHMETYLFAIPLLLKSGAAPLHFWFPYITPYMSWINCLILMTWQKLAPMILMMYFMNKLLPILSILSIFVGAAGGLINTSMKKVMTYSSINNTGWLMMALFISEKIWEIYFITYSAMTSAIILMLMHTNMSSIKQSINPPFNTNDKIITTLSFMSLGGMPPMSGFFPKFMIMKYMINLSMILEAFLLLTVSLLVLYFYLTMMIFFLISKNPSMKINLNIKNNKIKTIILMNISLNILPSSLLLIL